MRWAHAAHQAEGVARLLVSHKFHLLVLGLNYFRGLQYIAYYSIVFAYSIIPGSSPVKKKHCLIKKNLIPESCTKYRSEAQKALYLKRSWSDFDPQAYYLYGEDQNHETSFKNKALQAAVDSWCKIQVITRRVGKGEGK